jgi:hypothetical protein
MVGQDALEDVKIVQFWGVNRVGVGADPLIGHVSIPHVAINVIGEGRLGAG